jgi:crotonobetainyl-CoA hydratase
MAMLLAGAAEALRNGLVNEVVALDELDQAVGRWVADILACAPLSVRWRGQSRMTSTAGSSAFGLPGMRQRGQY